ncbi:site-specific integrase [Rhodobacteraceae bacterium DSL-40]|uniref:site-specific integrase n=1 Tax=Amaricoccus sp. B4 TaxID=3368557 RepID=UPI000DAD4E2A
MMRLNRRKRNQTHLEYRPTGFHWRRRWPRAVLENFSEPPPSGSFLLFPLRTHVPCDAKTIAQRLTLLSDLVFQALTERAMPIAPQTMDTLLVGLCRFQIEAADLARELAPERTLDAARYEQACAMASLDTVRTAILCRNRDIARAPLREVATRLGVVLDEEDTDWPRLAMRGLQVLLEAGEENLRRDQGQFQGEPRYLEAALSGALRPAIQGPRDMAISARQRQLIAPLPFPDPSRQAEVHAIPAMESAGTQASPTPARGASDLEQDMTDANFPAPAADVEAESLPVPKPLIRPGTQTMEPKIADKTACPTIMAGSEQYIALRSQGYRSFKAQEQANADAGQSWAKSSAHNVRSTARLMSRIHGDRPFDTLTDAEIKRSWELIVRLPKGYQAATSKLSPQEAADQADSKDLHNATITRARMAKNGDSPGKIESRILLERTKRMRAGTVYRHMQDFQRICVFLVKKDHLASNIMAEHIWESAELDRRQILEEDNERLTWCGHLDPLFRTPVFRSDLKDPGDPLFWGPLIAVHMGLRSEEILQLYLADIQVFDDVPCIVLRQGPGQSLKSRASRRIVPIHENLLALGIMKLVALRQSQDEPRLFPWIERSQAKKTYTENFSKQFTHYRQKNGIYDANRDFHSFRTTFNHLLIEAECPDTQRRYLMGHVERDIGITNYNPDGFSKKLLLKRVNAVEIDVSMIRQPFGEADQTNVCALSGHLLRAVK